MAKRLFNSIQFLSRKSLPLIFGVLTVGLLHQTAAYGATGTFRDEFSSQSYSNNNGSQNWNGAWVESGDDGLATGGDILVDPSFFDLIIDNDDASPPQISRSANLTGADTANLTFLYGVVNSNLESDDQIAVEVSQDGVSNWVTLETFSGNVGGTASYDISDYIGANTSIRFRVVQGYSGDNEFLFVDNVDITAVQATTNNDFSLTCSSSGSLDVLFILDDSGSISSTDLAEQRLAVLDTLDYFINNGITANAAIARFSSNSSTVIDYTAVTSANRSAFETALTNNYGTTGVGAGNLTDWEAGFQAGVNLGVANPDVTFFFTDGIQNEGSSPIDEAESFKLEGVHIYGIGIGTDVGLDDFRDVTDGPNTSQFDGTNITEADYVAIASYADLRNEFSNFVTDICSATLSGVVFEDVNYGGGEGRPLGTAGAVGRNGVTVELYDASGNFVTSTTTQTLTSQVGSYEFTGLSVGTYQTRVVNSTVTSSRSLNGAATTAETLAVQTYRFDPDASTPAIVDEIGGATPAEVDSAANTTSANLSTLTTPQSVTTLALSGNTTGVDFGFNFDTIVNTNDAGQGSLRQFLINSNALDNTGLDQDDSHLQSFAAYASETLAPGDEHSIFMIPTSDSGYVATEPDGGTGNTFLIQPNSNLPAIADDNTALDGRLQTATTGDTNAAVAEVSTGPEVVIDVGGFANSAGLEIDTVDNILIHSIGILNPSSTGNDGSAIYVEGSTGSDIRQSTLVNAARYGTTLRSSTTIAFEENVSRDNGQDNTTNDGLEIAVGTTDVTVRNNQFINNNGFGVDLNASPAPHTVLIENNLIKGNGIAGSDQAGGIGIRDTTGDVIIRQNEIQSNSGSGVVIRGAGEASGVIISQNSIFDNISPSAAGRIDGIGIDLTSSTQQLFGDGVTPNDDGDSDAGGNTLLNFPVFETAQIEGSNLVLTGFARPGVIIELFIAADDPTGFGEGQTYLISLTEDGTGANTTVNATNVDSISDLDATTGTYTDDGTGATSTKTTNRFEYQIPLTSLPGVSIGSHLTATATELTGGTFSLDSTTYQAGNTSEFSAVQIVSGTPGFLLVKRVTAIGSTAITGFVDGAGTDDNDPQWPANYIQGSIDTSTVQPGEEIEYTIYFLSNGNVGLVDVDVCDLIPTYTTYVAESGELVFGTDPAIDWNDARNTDEGDYFSPNTTILDADVPGVGNCRSDRNDTADFPASENVNGAIWVELDKNTTPLPAGQAGYIRFRVTVDETPTP